MATNGAVRWVVKAKLETIGAVQDDNKLKVEVVLPWSKHKTTMYIPDEDLGNRRAGTEQVMLVEQGNPRKKQDGSYTEYDWPELNYWWNFVEFTDQEPNWAPNRRPSGGGESSDRGSYGDYRRSKEEMRFIDSMHIAAHLIGPVATVEDLSEGFFTQMNVVARHIYEMIEVNGALLAPAQAKSANGQNQQESAPARRPQSKPDDGKIHPGQIRKIQGYVEGGVIVAEEIVTVCKQMFGDHIQKPTTELTFDETERLIEYLEQVSETKKLLSGAKESNE